MFEYWLIFLSSDNRLLQLYENQDIAKEPVDDDQVVPFILVEKLDGTIDCIDNFSRQEHRRLNLNE